MVMNFKDCLVTRDDEVLVLETSRIRRVFRWNGGNLISTELVDKESDTTWTLAGSATDCSFPGQGEAALDGELSVRQVPTNGIYPDFLEAVVSCRLGELEVRRRFRLYPDCPAIASDLSLRGKATQALWASSGLEAAAMSQLENLAAKREGRVERSILDRIDFAYPHLRVRNVEFFDVTDRRNNLVYERDSLVYTGALELPGQLAIVSNTISGQQFFLLKESPCSDVQLAYEGCNFTADRKGIRMIGVGLTPADLSPGEWTSCYGAVVGVAAPGEHAVLCALRDYQSRLRVFLPERDSMIMLNTWGDRSQDGRLGEGFAIAEIESAQRLGISHFQLDDGWQKGRSKNSAFEGGSNESIWERNDFWEVHPERFPHGFDPLLAAADKAGVEVCIWFNPAEGSSYRETWEKDAEVLIGLYKRYGIRVFKIDGVQLPTKTEEIYLRKLFEKVLEATDNQAVFNLDMTAGRRFGYHYFNEFGNRFLENRYTDWGNYYPHTSLRNLWMLSRYVPPQSLQIEFLNVWRNRDRYPADDPLAPGNVPFDYCFAITMAAQPLAWFECANLPEEAYEIAPLVKTFREHQARIHAGCILPIGAEPDGGSWTGFQSATADGEGYCWVFRELNENENAAIKLWGLAGETVEFLPLAGTGRAFSTIVPTDGSVCFEQMTPFSFTLYRYRCGKSLNVLE